MVLAPLRLIAWLLALLVVGVPLAALGLFLLAVLGSPRSCQAEGRPISPTPEAAASFQSKWDQLNAALNEDQNSTATFSESEVTAQARDWVGQHEVPVSDLFICFSDGAAAASGKIDVPLFPGDLDVLVRGRADLTGQHPDAVIEDVEVGRLPGPLSGLAEGFINALIDNQEEEIILTHDFGATFGEGEIRLTGQP